MITSLCQNGSETSLHNKDVIIASCAHWCMVFEGLVCSSTVYPKKYAHGFVVLCFVVVMQSFIMNSHEVFIHIHQGCFAGTGAIVRLPQCQWSKPDGYGKISQCITTIKHSKAKTVCIFLGIYCSYTSSVSSSTCSCSMLMKNYNIYLSSFCRWRNSLGDSVLPIANRFAL